MNDPATIPPPSEPAKDAARSRGATAPFLAWPVSRRAFYRAVFLAMLPTLGWGVTLFGFRALAIILPALAAAATSHYLLKRTGWGRAKTLMLFHCLLAAAVLAALAQPTWTAWPVALAAFLLPLLFALLGGPGKEPLHVAVVLAAAIQFAVLPAIAGRTYTQKQDAVLARDRLFMGDIRDQSARSALVPFWPSSRELVGNDASPYPMPALPAARTLDAVAGAIPNSNSGQPDAISPQELKQIEARFERAFALELPPMDAFLWGIAPNRVGAASLIAIALAGLYLSYRYILRPRSVLLFMVAFVLGTVVFLLPPWTVQRIGPAALWALVSTYPGQIFTLFHFMLLSSDAAFAAVFILALPGTEPLTPRGRRVFLVAAALIAAGLHRCFPTLPAATFTLTAMMPLTRGFDWAFRQWSWLER